MQVMVMTWLKIWGGLGGREREWYVHRYSSILRLDLSTLYGFQQFVWRTDPEIRRGRGGGGVGGRRRNWVGQGKAFRVLVLL